jgi:sugar phosphate isomerase/epimerase
MKGVDGSVKSTRRQFLAGTLALAGSAMAAQKKYSPRIVCNMYYYVQLFSTPFRYISSRPDPQKNPAPPGQPGQQPPRQAPTGGTIWTPEQWFTAFSDVHDAGYRRLEMLSGTVMARPMEEILALLAQYDLLINHVWHSGLLYPQQIGERTIANTIEVLDRCKPLKSPDFFFDPFGDRGPLSDEDARAQNRGLDRLGREVKDRGMKLCVHNHEGPMRYGAKEWLGVLNNTDPALVTLCLDLDWTWQAGTDPFPLLYEAGDKGRLGAIHMRTQHMKIADQTMEDGGDIDFHKAAAYLKKIKFDGALVEETEWMKETRVTRSARENKKLARIWCEKVFGVSAKV